MREYRASSVAIRRSIFAGPPFIGLVLLALFLLATFAFPALLAFWKLFSVSLVATLLLRKVLPPPLHNAADRHAMVVTVTDDHVVFRHHPDTPEEKTTRLARVRVKSGFVVPHQHMTTLSLKGPRGADVANMELAGSSNARELLHELGLSPLERPMTFSFFFNLRVTVGVDGVLVALPLLGRRQFVSHKSIVDIRQTSDSVILALRNGQTFDIATGGGEQHTALVERLVEATRAYVDADHAEPVALLRQSGRTTSAWVKELRMLMESAGAGYRSATIPEETLWRVALDPSEPAEHRIGAGLALRPKLDDEGRARLRVAAEAAASPKVRIALETAADEIDDEALADVLQRS